MHFPERWGYVFFDSDEHISYQIPAAEEVKNYLWLVYYKQKDYYKNFHAYAINLNDLNIPITVQIAQKDYHLSLTGTALQFTDIISEDGTNRSWTIDEDGKVM